MYPNLNNECRFEGRLIKDPELSFIPLNKGGSLSKVKFMIAVDKNLSKKQKDEAKAKGEPTSDFIPCECVGPKAEMIANYFKKGKPIKVSALYKSYSYTNKTGDKVYAHSFDVVDVGFTTQDHSENAGTSSKGTGNIPNDYFGDPAGMTPVDDEDLPF